MPTLTSIAEALLEKARKLDAYIDAKGLPSPSFAHDSFAELPAELEEARTSLADGSNDLKRLAQGPATVASEISFTWTDTLSLRGVYHFKLAQAVPLDGSASFEEISKHSGLAEPMVYRFIRMAMTNGMFDQDSSGRIVHTAITRLLVTDADFADAIGLQVEELGPAASRFIDAMEKFGQEAQEPNHNAFALFNDTDTDLYGFLGQHPERARRFGGAMRFYTHDSGWDLSHILNAIDFSSIDRPGALLVDVAGGHGQIPQYFARHTKDIRFLVQDLPHVAEAGSRELPSDLKSRIEFESHDIFDPQTLSSPPTAFLLSRILHNWPDKYCVQILQSLVPAMEKGTKLFIYDHVLKDEPVKTLGQKSGL